ncbi:hypothetical protein ABTP39_19020, partial [Acinetobacter baumannii]
MKRWRTESSTWRGLATAALAIFLAAGWVGEPRAESPAVGTLSPEALRQLGDTVRGEIAAKK